MGRLCNSRLLLHRKTCSLSTVTWRGEPTALSTILPSKPAPAFDACWGILVDPIRQESTSPAPLKSWTNGPSPWRPLNTSWNNWCLAHGCSEILWQKQRPSSVPYLSAGWPYSAGSLPLASSQGKSLQFKVCFCYCAMLSTFWVKSWFFCSKKLSQWSSEVRIRSQLSQNHFSNAKGYSNFNLKTHFVFVWYYISFTQLFWDQIPARKD